MNEEFTIAVFSEDKPGVLHRATTCFTRRKINIESLNVSASEVPGISRFTIVIQDVEESDVVSLCHSLEKQVDIEKAFWYRDADGYVREIALYKVRPEQTAEGSPTRKIFDEHKASVIVEETEFSVVQKTGHREETQALFDALQGDVLEFVRSGRVLISKPMKELKTYLAELEADSKR